MRDPEKKSDHTYSMHERRIPVETSKVLLSTKLGSTNHLNSKSGLKYKYDDEYQIDTAKQMRLMSHTKDDQPVVILEGQVY